MDKMFLDCAQVAPDGRPCPACSNKMRTVYESGASGKIPLQICHICYCVWFDPGEFEQAPPPEAPPAKVELKDLPLEAREIMAIGEVRRIKKEGEASADPFPDEGWEIVPAILGLPVIQHPRTLKRFPIVTWSLIGIVSIVSVLASLNPEDTFQQFGFIPHDPFRMNGLTFITSFFLHVGGLHLIGNMLAWVIFGPEVEDFLGRWKYLFLIFLSAAAGNFVELLVTPAVTVPTIGASVGIFGVMAYYMFKFPYHKITLMVRVFFIALPAYAVLIFILLLQFVGAYMQFHGWGDVAYLAHLGGVSVGLIFALMTRPDPGLVLEKQEAKFYDG